MGARVVVGVIAVLVIAWTGVLLRDQYTGRDAATRSLFAAELTPAERLRDRERIADADLLDPSSYWALAHAGNLLRSGDSAGAARETDAIVRDEPDNVPAWELLRAATRASDPARANEAAARLRELNPFGSR